MRDISPPIHSMRPNPLSIQEPHGTARRSGPKAMSSSEWGRIKAYLAGVTESRSGQVSTSRGLLLWRRTRRVECRLAVRGARTFYCRPDQPGDAGKGMTVQVHGRKFPGPAASRAVIICQFREESSLRPGQSLAQSLCGVKVGVSMEWPAMAR